MHARKSSRRLLFGLFAILVLMLPACLPAAPTTSPQPTATQVVPATQPSTGTTAGITLDYPVVAQDVTVETVAAQTASEGGPFWDGAPAYRLLTLQGYPVTSHLRKPQIFIFLVADLASANETMGKYAAELKTLLQTRQAGNQLPFLPLSNEGQLIRARMEFVDFKGGQGVHFLTQLAQGMIPINNNELIFVFQGLTSDGKYYIAAILPVTNSELPADATMNEEQIQAFNDYPVYRSSMVNLLNQQPAGSFTPDLRTLDALIRSIEVK